MNCREAETLIDLYISQDLSSRKRNRVHAHLMDCKKCYSLLRESRLCHGVIGDYFEHLGGRREEDASECGDASGAESCLRGSPSMADRVLDRLREDRTPGSSSDPSEGAFPEGRSDDRRSFVRWRGAITLASVALILLALSLSFVASVWRERTARLEDRILARVARVEGRVRAYWDSGDGWRWAEKGSEVRLGETLETEDRGSSVVLHLSDGSRARFDGRGSLEFRESPEGESRILSLAGGRLQVSGLTEQSGVRVESGGAGIEVANGPASFSLKDPLSPGDETGIGAPSGSRPQERGTAKEDSDSKAMTALERESGPYDPELEPLLIVHRGRLNLQTQGGTESLEAPVQGRITERGFSEVLPGDRVPSRETLGGDPKPGGSPEADPVSPRPWRAGGFRKRNGAELADVDFALGVIHGKCKAFQSLFSVEPSALREFEVLSAGCQAFEWRRKLFLMMLDMRSFPLTAGSGIEGEGGKDPAVSLWTESMSLLVARYRESKGFEQQVLGALLVDLARHRPADAAAELEPLLKRASPSRTPAIFPCFAFLLGEKIDQQLIDLREQGSGGSEEELLLYLSTVGFRILRDRPPFKLTPDPFRLRGRVPEETEARARRERVEFSRRWVDVLSSWLKKPTQLRSKKRTRWVSSLFLRSLGPFLAVDDEKFGTVDASVLLRYRTLGRPSKAIVDLYRGRWEELNSSKFFSRDRALVQSILGAGVVRGVSSQFVRFGINRVLEFALDAGSVVPEESDSTLSLDRCAWLFGEFGSAGGGSEPILCSRNRYSFSARRTYRSVSSSDLVRDGYVGEKNPLAPTTLVDFFVDGLTDGFGWRVDRDPQAVETGYDRLRDSFRRDGVLYTSKEIAGTEGVREAMARVLTLPAIFWRHRHWIELFVDPNS